MTSLKPSEDHFFHDAKVRRIGGPCLTALVLIGMMMVIAPNLIRKQINQEFPYPSVTAEQDLLFVVTDVKRNFATAVLAETDEVWSGVFQKMGRTYQKPKMVLFSGAVESACGVIESAVGPFYCPIDRKIYLDPTFFDELQSRFGASGKLTPTYVIAHEVGHHVQTQLGITRKIADLYARSNSEDHIRLSVMVELQADCLAGVWAHHARKKHNILSAFFSGEILNRAGNVHHDRIEKMTRDYAAPDDFLHGCASLRTGWFKRGLDQGSFQACNAFDKDLAKIGDITGIIQKSP